MIVIIAIIAIVAGFMMGDGDEDGPIDNEKEPVKIGILAPQQHFMGESEVRNVTMAAEEINENGGILGREIEIVTRDTNLDSDTATTNFRKLVEDDGVDVIFGGFRDGVIQTTMNTMAELEMLWLGDGASPETLQPIVEQYDDFKYFFRVDMANSGKFPFDHQLMLEYFREEKDLDIDRVAFIRDDLVYTVPFMEVLENIYEDMGIEMVMEEPVPLDVSGAELGNLLSQANSLNADMVQTLTAQSDTTPLVEAWSQSKPNMLLAGQSLSSVAPDSWVRTDGAVEYTAWVADGGTALAPITDKMLPFIEKYKDRYDELPNAHIAPDFYDGVFMYKQAVEAADEAGEEDPFDPETLVSYLEAIDENNPYDGIQGPKAFTDMHQLKWGTDYIRCWPLQWRGVENQVVFAPDERATGEFVLPPWIEPSDFEE